MIKTRSLKTQIGITVGISFFLFSSLLAMLGMYYSFQLIKAESEEKLKNLIESQAKNLDTDFVAQRILAEDIFNAIQITFDTGLLMNQPGYLDQYEEFISPFVYRIAEKYHNSWVYFNPYLENTGHDVWFADMNRDGIPERQPEQNLSYYENRENKAWFFEPMDTGKALWSNPYETTIFEDKSIHWISYSIPVFIKGRFIAVTGHDFLFSDFRDNFIELSVYGSGYGILLNDRYELIIHPEFVNFENLAEIDDGRYKWMTEMLDNNENGILRYSWIDGKKMILAFSHLSNNWILAITANEEAIYSQFYNQIRLMGIIFFLGILITTWIVLKITSRLTLGLEQVSSIISETGRGNYENPIPAHYLTETSEIGILSRAVEEMRVRQKESFDEIQLYNENLEDLIKERTTELLNSIEELKTTQRKLVDYKKFKATHRFLMEIAHRLNTPLGNAGMAISIIEYKIQEIQTGVKNQAEAPDLETIDSMKDSLRILQSGIDESKGIISSLLSITNDFNNAESKQVNLLEIIQKSSIEFNKNTPFTKLPALGVKTNCQRSFKMVTYPHLLGEAFINLFKYSLKYGTAEDMKMAVSMDVSYRDGFYRFEYHDKTPLKYKEFKNRIFEPYSIRSFKADSDGMEMYILYHIIELGLKGTIEMEEGDMGSPYFIITLPDITYASEEV